MTLKRIYESAADAERDALANGRDRAEKARAKAHAARDPAVHLIRRVRAYEQNLADAEARARDAYHAMHASVPSGVPLMIHPQVAALLAEFLTGNDLVEKDLTLPLHEDGEPLSVMIAKARIAAQAEHQKAVNALASMEREQAEAEVAAAQARLADVVALYGAAVEVLPAEAPLAVEPPRRGRPPKVQGIDISALGED